MFCPVTWYKGVQPQSASPASPRSQLSLTTLEHHPGTWLHPSLPGAGSGANRSRSKQEKEQSGAGASKSRSRSKQEQEKEQAGAGASRSSRVSKRCGRATERLLKKFQMLRKIWVLESKNALFNTFLPLFEDFV